MAEMKKRRTGPHPAAHSLLEMTPVRNVQSLAFPLRSAFALLLICSLASLLFCDSAHAVQARLGFHPDYIVVNSRDWRDVYSGMLFSELIGSEGMFIMSQEEAVLKVRILPADAEEVLIIENTAHRYYAGFESLVSSRGVGTERISSEDSLNLELAEVLDISSFIVLSDQFGYNAISVAPYALLTGSYVLFADSENIGRVAELIEEREANVMVYGSVDSEVREELRRFSPTVIDKGSKVDNNLEIAGMFLELKKVNQSWIVSGDELYRPIFSDKNPVVFIGKGVVPQKVDDFILKYNLRYLVLIGNELAPMVNSYKQEFEAKHRKGFFVAILIGRSPREINFAGDSIEAIDQFQIPSPLLGIEITDIYYNQITEELAVTYTNTEDAPLYFSSSILLASPERQLSVGDESPVFLSGGKARTILYYVGSMRQPVNLSATVIYGEDRVSLELLYTFREDTLDFLEIVDDSKIDLVSAEYDRLNNALFVKVRNSGKVTAYFDLEVDMRIGGNMQTLYAPEVYRLEEGESREVVIRQKLTSLDIEENPTVTLRAYYSQRAESLIKLKEAELPLEIRLPGYVYLGAAVVAVAVLAMLLLLWRRRKRRA